MIAGSDVFWDRITSIESIGLRPVYDATVLGTHNFIANGTNLHNSIEQDADVVILLHREDAYERETPPGGRGGPDRREAQERADRDGDGGLPRALQPLRRHGPG